MFFSLNINRHGTTAGAVMLIAAAGCFIAYKIVHIPLQLEMVLLFSLAAFYPILRQPSIGLYLIFGVMPLISFIRRLYYLLHQRPTSDPLIITGDILTAITLIGLFFAFKEQRPEQQYARTTKNIVLIYLIYVLLRIFILNAQPLTEAIMRFRFYGPAVLLFFIGNHFATRTTLLKRLWGLTIVLGIVAALYGFKQLFFGYSISEKLWFSNVSFTTLFIKGLARPFSFFQSPAAFADYMQISIIGILILYRSTTSAYRILLPPFIMLFFYGALITSVRSNWIGIILSLIVWFSVLTIRKKGRRVITIGILLGLYLVIQVIFDAGSGLNIESVFQTIGGGDRQSHLSMLIAERSSALANPFEEYSFLSRLNLWRYILALSTDPIMALFGRGGGAFKADSLYFTYLAEFGYPGLVFIIGFIVFTIRKGLGYIDRADTPDTISIVKGITLMNIVFAVVNITGTHIHSFPGDAFFWFWNGVLIELSASPFRKQTAHGQAQPIPVPLSSVHHNSGRFCETHPPLPKANASDT